MTASSVRAQGAPLSSPENKSYTFSNSTHTLTHFNQQEQPNGHHARCAAAHGLPATRGAGFDKQQ